MDIQLFQKNQQWVPPEELAKYAGQFVAWSADGTSIPASDNDELRLARTVKSCGHDTAEVSIAFVPVEDVVLPGGSTVKKDESKSRTIEIVDRGRGLQLSTSRVTVLDLVPYFQQGSTYEEINRWIPTLSRDEIAVVDQYYRSHKDDLDEKDRIIRQRSSCRKNPEWVEKVLAEARVERSATLERLRQQQANGDSG